MAITRFQTREEARKVLPSDSLEIKSKLDGDKVVIDATYNAVLKEGTGVALVEGVKISGTMDLSNVIEDSVRMATYRNKQEILAGQDIDLNAEKEKGNRSVDPVIAAIRDSIRAKAAARGLDAKHVTNIWVRAALNDENHPSHKTVKTIHDKIVVADQKEFVI